MSLNNSSYEYTGFFSSHDWNFIIMTGIFSSHDQNFIQNQAEDDSSKHLAFFAPSFAFFI